MNESIVIRKPAISPTTAFDGLDISASTKAEYHTRLNDFLGFCRLNGFHVDTYLHYKQHLAGRDDLGVSAKNKYLVASRAYLKELHRRGSIPVDITSNVKAFKQTKKHKRVGLTQEEVERLMDFLNHDIDPSEPQNTRLKALVSLLLFQGLRQCEVSRLNWQDVNLKHGLVFIQVKGRDDKEPIYLHPETSKALESYLATNDIITLDESGNYVHGPLFVSRSNSSKNQRLTTRGIHSIISPILDALGIDKTVHGFRHYFTTALIKHYEGHLLEVARYTRHRAVEMLQVYNDAILEKADLPQFYKAFDGLSFE